MTSLTLATFGTILIDNIHRPDGSTERHLGGGALYAAIGARVWLPPETIRLPTGCSRRGVPKTTTTTTFLDELERFGGVMWAWDEDSEEAMLETEIVYTPGGARSFRYLNPRGGGGGLQPVASWAHRAGYLHFCCSPTDLSASLSTLPPSAPRPKIIYEPLPLACGPAHLSALKSVLPLVDVFSPNHEELASFFHDEEEEGESIEALVSTYARLGARTVVVRAGARGCFVANMDPALGACAKRWLPPYWTDEASQNVRDTTGAGNSFLGGLCAGMAMALAGDDVFLGAAYGAVSASFVVQQPGLPSLLFCSGEETWNGECPRWRLERYLSRGEYGWAR
ncbi:Ribokinase-like protein [Guyanagaster necrorhizus]|uniref:Ribokinase-like protein n=1 Tax=Guyanagaster necrorhizus TaxID=856835 RepID=A0A9P7VN86_9AGAR|nr:Ribokinase-like protein [Guyanagaster necrorhizus MCA 3950]KAG7443445.1 Ribokinase-like protein [Guyanagaster necrorhizus MCA 3950]